MKPICVPCERFMRPKRNGLYFVEGMPHSHPTEEWDGESGKGSTGWAPYQERARNMPPDPEHLADTPQDAA